MALGCVHDDVTGLPGWTINISTWVAQTIAINAAFARCALHISACIGLTSPFDTLISVGARKTTAGIGRALPINTRFTYGTGDEGARIDAEPAAAKLIGCTVNSPAGIIDTDTVNTGLTSRASMNGTVTITTGTIDAELACTAIHADAWITAATGLRVTFGCTRALNTKA